MGTVLEGEAGHLLGGGDLQIERRRNLRPQSGDVVIADMTAILPQVGGDQVGAGADGGMGGAHRIGMDTAARIA